MLPTLRVAMDTTALLLALPRLSADLGATNVQQLWISELYGFLLAGLVITMGHARRPISPVRGFPEADCPGSVLPSGL